MKKLIVPTLAALSVAACQQQPATPGVEVSDLICRPTPNGRDVTACFATFTSNVDDRLVAISSPDADDVQIHSVRTDNGMMVMREMENGLSLPAGESIRLRPGGDHIMIIGVHTPLAEGDLLSLAMTFEHAPELGLRAEVGAPPVEGEGGGHH